MSRITANQHGERAPGTGRRRLWLAAGVAGVVGLAAIGGVAARDTSSDGTRGGSDSPASAPRQNVSDAGPAGGNDSGGVADDRAGDGQKRDRREKDRKHDGRAQEVPCHTDKLIQAIVRANETGGGVLELAKGCTYQLTRSEHGNGLPVIKEPIVLKGHDTKIVRAATADFFRILNVGRGGHLTLKDVTVKGGQTAADLIGSMPAPVRVDVAGARAAKAAQPGPAPGRGTVATPPATSTGGAQPLVSGGPSDGAAILVQRGGKAHIEDSKLLQNQAGGHGGAIANYGTTTVAGSLIERNSAAGVGGGVFNAGVLRVEQSRVSANTAALGGGGIANGGPTPGGTVWVWKSTIAHNRTSGGGGGVFASGGDTTLRESKVIDNYTGADVGGIVVQDFGKLYLEYVEVARNFARGDIGGVGAQSSTAVIQHSVIRQNVASGDVGGLFNFQAFVTVQDSEVVANQATGGSAVAGGVFNAIGVTKLIRTKVVHNMSTLPPGGIWTNSDGVTIDKKSAVKDNRPTNCQGSPVIPDNCFG